MCDQNRLELNNCNFTGSLPAQWASSLPALQLINISSNLLTGGALSSTGSQKALFCMSAAMKLPTT